LRGGRTWDRNGGTRKLWEPTRKVKTRLEGGDVGKCLRKTVTWSTKDGAKGQDPIQCHQPEDDRGAEPCAFRDSELPAQLGPSVPHWTAVACRRRVQKQSITNGRDTNSRVLPESNRSTTDCHFHCWRLSVVGGKEALRGLVVGLYTALHSTQDAVCPRMAGWVFGGSTGEPAWCFFWAASVSGSHSDSGGLEWFSSCTCRH
jgi:hypothetical protein